MVKLLGSFGKLRPKKILVAGDLLLDKYTIGKARRISPEAPVAIVHVTKEEERPGGAGNTLLNLISMNASVNCFGRVGDDLAGQSLKKKLGSEGVNVEGIFIDPQFQTPIKNRIVSDNQQIVRIDHEKVTPLSLEVEEKALLAIPSLLHGVSILAISDYGKGFLTKRILKGLIAEAKKQGVYVIADPKGTDFERYHGVDLLKPNLSEAYAAAYLPLDNPLFDVAQNLFQKVEMQSLIITRSESGISLFERRGEQIDFPVKPKEVKDVTGAGDTVLAMMALALANQLSLSEAIHLSNTAAGIAIEQFGCARITLNDLAKRLLAEDVNNKIFDPTQFDALQAALRGTCCWMVTLAGDQIPSPSVLAKLNQTKKEGKIILALLEENPIFDETLHLISSLQSIDFILLNTKKSEVLKLLPSAVCL